MVNVEPLTWETRLVEPVTPTKLPVCQLLAVDLKFVPDPVSKAIIAAPALVAPTQVPPVSPGMFGIVTNVSVFAAKTNVNG